jgi:hypothetical protein
MRVIHVLRKPLSEGTVAANVVKHGCGGINIDASRVAAPGETISNHSRGDESAISKGIYGDSAGQETHQTEGQKSGRWPANVILQHLDGCRCEGIKRVKAIRTGVRDKSGEAHSKYRFQGEGTVRTDIHVGFADEDGKESVANWICEPGCPVAGLDEQSLSGGMHSAGNKQPAHFKIGNTIYAGEWKPTAPRNPDVYADKGGASRFFKQVGGGKDA